MNKKSDRVVCSKWAFKTEAEAMEALAGLLAGDTAISFGVEGPKGLDSQLAGFDFDDRGAALKLMRYKKLFVLIYTADYSAVTITLAEEAKALGVAVGKFSAWFSPTTFDSSRDLNGKDLRGEAYDFGDMDPMTGGRP